MFPFLMQAVFEQVLRSIFLVILNRCGNCQRDIFKGCKIWVRFFTMLLVIRIVFQSFRHPYRWDVDSKDRPAVIPEVLCIICQTTPENEFVIALFVAAPFPRGTCSRSLATSETGLIWNSKFMIKVQNNGKEQWQMKVNSLIITNDLQSWEITKKDEYLEGCTIETCRSLQQRFKSWSQAKKIKKK